MTPNDINVALGCKKIKSIYLSRIIMFCDTVSILQNTVLIFN